MTDYIVDIWRTYHDGIFVSADSPEEAIDKAYGLFDERKAELINDMDDAQANELDENGDYVY